VRKLRLCFKVVLPEMILKYCNLKILWQKAEGIAWQLSVDTLSSGWTDRFRKWPSLGCWTTSGESKCGNEDAVETQRTVVLPTLLANYEPKDMSGGDEYHTLYNLMSDKTCVFMGESCFVGTEASIITVLVSTNTDGFKKMLLLVSGKAEKPQYCTDDL
jgi:hypothetical protein